MMRGRPEGARASATMGFMRGARLEKRTPAMSTSAREEMGALYTRDRLGELLLRAGVITEDQLFDALAYQQEHGGKLGQVLVGNLVADEDAIARALADQKGLDHVSLAAFPVDREAAALVPARVAKRAMIIPIGFRDGALLLAMADPLDVEAIDDVHLRTKRDIVPVVATPAQIEYAIEKFITSAEGIESVTHPGTPEEP